MVVTGSSVLTFMVTRDANIDVSFTSQTCPSSFTGTHKTSSHGKIFTDGTIFARVRMTKVDCMLAVGSGKTGHAIAFEMVW